MDVVRIFLITKGNACSSKTNQSLKLTLILCNIESNLTLKRCNKLRKLLTICTLFVASVTFAQDFHVLQGYVVDENAEPLIGVIIRVQNTGSGTVTNDEGQYEIRLPEGLNRIHFSFIGYEAKTIEEVVRKNTVLNVTLTPDEEAIKAVEISNKRRDYSYEIIQKVIDNREKYRNQFQTQKCKIYVKSVEEITKTKTDKIDKDEEKDPFKNDSIPNLNLFEAEFIQHSEPPNGIKEEKLAAKKLGDQRTLFYTTTLQSEFDFNKNLIVVRKLGDNSYVSPLSTNGPIAYKFKLLGSRYEGDQKVYTIKVTPRKMGNALFKGEIEVWDKLFVLKSVNLEVAKNSLIMYDRFSIKQDYQFVDTKWVLANQQFEWKTKTNNDFTTGICDVTYSKYKFDSIYPKRFFNAEVGTTAEDAYEKDTTFWAQIRPVPLTTKERVFVDYQDSIRRLMDSEVYLDSIDSVNNKLTVMKLLLNGFGHINRAKKVDWSFDPVISMIDPVAIGGWRARYSVSYFKKFESRKSLYISPFLNYGFRNEDIKGNLAIGYLYNPKKLSRISLNTGKYFGFVNTFATFSDIFRRSNFYEQTHLYLSHRTELFNGFYANVLTSYISRQDLGNFKFSPIADTLYFDDEVVINAPNQFDEHTVFDYSIGIEFTPKQLYIQEPKEKIVLGSKYPTFSLTYKQAVPNVLNSSIDYKYLDFSIRQLFNIGVLGTSEYNIMIGGFLDTGSLKIMDYKYQRGGDPYFFLPPMYGYQMIDSTFPTFKGFLESHYVHQFNGFLTSKIPGLKQLKIKTMAGGGILYVPERNYNYSELFGGINRIFKIGKERLRLGIYYVVSQSNQAGFRSGFKFSLEPYNPSKNTWSF